MKSARQPAVRPERVVGCRRRQGIHCSVSVSLELCTELRNGRINFEMEIKSEVTQLTL